MPAAVVGRERELALGDTFLAEAAEGFCVLVLEGEAGIGKTTVWRQIARRAEERGFRVLACRPAATETKLALSAVADLLEGAADELLAALPDPQRRALEVALLRSEPETRAPEARTIATALRSLLASLSREQPVLVAVDDVQWLDAASARALAFAIRRLGVERMGWLFARRLGETDPIALDEVAAPSLRHVSIGPLTVGALHHVLKERFEEPLTRPVLVRICRASGGNPLHAVELGRELLRAGGAADLPSVPVPHDLRRLIWQRLRRLSPPTRDALLTASALSEPTALLVDEEALAPAEEADLVQVHPDGRISFRHPLYASAVYEHASRGRRRELHRNLATLVIDPEERARHLAFASTGTNERVARTLEEGAAVARARGSWESAAELLERAGELTPARRTEDRVRRRIAAAEHHAHAGDRARAEAILEALLATPLPRAQRADALRLLGEITHNTGNFPEAVRLLEEALETADDPLRAAAVGVALSYVLAGRMQWATGRAHAYRALELAEQVADRPLLAEALSHCAMLDFCAGNGVDWAKVERALELEDVDAVVTMMRRPQSHAAMLLLYVGRHHSAREHLRALADRARDRGDESDLAFLLLWWSWLETRAGNFGAAANLADDASALATLTGAPSMHAWTLTQTAYVRAHHGDVEGTRRACAEAAEPVQRSGNLLPGLWIAASVAVLELSLGNPEAAAQACEPLVQAVELHGIGEPVPLFFLPDALEALIALGRVDRAEPLVDVLEERGRQLDRAWALATAGRCRGLLLAARGEIDGAAAALERALVEHERLDMPFERARTLLVKGVVERRARRRGSAKACFEEAGAVFDRLGAPRWAERARAELDRVGLRRSAPGQLTEGERRMAELAGRGSTRREIAAALHVSPKTVDANLARVYRKLGISSRAELGARVSELVQE